MVDDILYIRCLFIRETYLSGMTGRGHRTKDSEHFWVMLRLWNLGEIGFQFEFHMEMRI